MDNTIRMILELDAAADQRLQDAADGCTKTLEEAKQKAAALNEARSHQTSDAVFEFEEQTRAECESQTAKLQSEYEAQSATLEELFAARQDTLLTELYQAVLADAEA